MNTKQLKVQNVNLVVAAGQMYVKFSAPPFSQLIHILLGYSHQYFHCLICKFSLCIFILTFVALWEHWNETSQLNIGCARIFVWCSNCFWITKQLPSHPYLNFCWKHKNGSKKKNIGWIERRQSWRSSSIKCTGIEIQMQNKNKHAKITWHLNEN